MTEEVLLLCPGQCQFCEPTGLANVADIFHVNTVGQLLMSFDVSSSKQALAFGDSGGCVHLWSDAPEVSFNDYSRETEFALPCLVDTLPQLDWNHDLLPISLIPMPLTSTEPLLSDWPTALATPSPRWYTLTKFFDRWKRKHLVKTSILLDVKLHQSCFISSEMNESASEGLNDWLND